MLREFLILLCAGTFVYGGVVNNVRDKLDQSSDSKSDAAPGDHLALPSASYQNVAPPTKWQLPSEKSSYEVKPAVVESIAESSAVKTVPVKTPGSADVKQQTVTISASVASDPSTPEYKNILERYTPPVEPVKPYFSVPVAAKSITVGSPAEVPVATGTYGNIVRPYVVYTNTAPQTFYNVPVGPAKTVIETHEGTNIQSASYGTQTVVPAVQYAAHSAPRPFYVVPLATKTAVQSQTVLTAQSPAVATYPVNSVQTVTVSPPVAQYVPDQKLYSYNVKTVVPTVPVASNKVTVESYSSVTSHPPPAVKYAHVPIPVPVIYPQVETRHPAEQQLVLTKTITPTAVPVVVKSQVPVVVPVKTQIPVAVNDARLQYQPIPVYGGHQSGYAKAVLFSPASEVSRVTFNGLGVSYGW